MKHLTLNRETLRSLDTVEISAAQGGVSERICLRTQTCFVSYCNCPTQASYCGPFECYATV
ncbi:MAG TPA: hypothetical protein VMW27_03100 [Thermoanaerobaculia bacterium]|nr:hypothetical protein [Thermoanaerobaculia bacterium]